MHPQIPDFQIVISGPNTVLSEKNASMESLFVQLSDDIYISILKKLTLMIGFVVQGHIYRILHYFKKG